VADDADFADEDHEELFLDSVRSTEDAGAVLEEADGTCYFYLVELLPEYKIIAAIHVQSGPLTFRERDVEIQWSADESLVGLFICRKLWAAYDFAERKNYGGHYAGDKSPNFPGNIAQRFLLQ
jgi:hypothetical protein